MTRTLAIATALCLLVTLTLLWIRRAAPQGDGPAQTQLGATGAKPQGDRPHTPQAAAGCEACHALGHEAPGGAHPPRQVGCADCHLGDTAATDQALAHEGMEREPGALDTAALTCGRADCHVSTLATVLTSPMTRAVGIVTVDSFAFGEAALTDGSRTLADVLSAEHPSPSDDHLRRLCAGCHLGTRRANRDDAITQGGSGCAACHLGAAQTPGAHPPVDTQVADTRCLGCHSRSGRVSLSYQGLAEVRGPDQAACAQATTLHDGRPGCAVQDDAHHAAGLACIDCHLHTELMGDGHLYVHREEAVQVRCQSCHDPAAPTAPWGTVHDTVSARLLKARGQQRAPDEPARLGARGTPLWNLRPGGGTWQLQGKLDGAMHAVPATPSDAQHGLAGHEALSCASCHSAWAPTCVDCHTTYASDQQQWDFSSAALAPGAWVEHAERFGVAPPTLAVTASGSIEPAVPGMIATLDATTAGGSAKSRRLFAALDPHTTSKQGRSCAACHRDPRALGLGTGALILGASGPQFTPASPAPDGSPGLAADGWVALYPETPGEGTRPGLRSLSSAQQRRALRVGVCVSCHTQAGDAIYADLPGATSRLMAGQTRCTQPRWAWLEGQPAP